MNERTGHEPAINITAEDWAAVQALTQEILEGMDCVNTVKFRRHIEAVLARNIMHAAERYEAQLAEEEIHKWEFGQHHISQCQPDWCGRYRGQRRDSVVPEELPPPSQHWDSQHGYGSNEPDPGWPPQGS